MPTYSVYVGKANDAKLQKLKQKLKLDNESQVLNVALTALATREGIE